MGTRSRHWDWALGWDGGYWERALGRAPGQGGMAPGTGTGVGTGRALGPRLDTGNGHRGGYWDGTGMGPGAGTGQLPGQGWALQRVPGQVRGSQGEVGPSGTACSAAGPVRVPALPCPPRRYMCSLSLFHYSEYLVTAINNPRSLSLDSFLLNHSFEYNLAALSSWVEFTLEKLLVPGQLGRGGAEPPVGVFFGLRNEWRR